MALTQTSTAPPLSERRFDRTSWITMAIGLVILALGVMVSVASYGIPADGWLVDKGTGRYTNPIYLTSLPGSNPNLQPGDVLLELEGESFELLEARAVTLKSQRPENWETGETVRYTLLRDGSEIVVPITLQRPPLAPYYRPPILQNNLEALSTLIFLLMGGLLFVLRPRQRATQLLFLFGIAIFVDDLTTWGAGVPSGVADLFSPATYWPRIILGTLIWIFVIWPVAVHLFLIFPLPKRVLRSSLTIPLIYGVPVVVSLLFILLSVSGYFVSEYILLLVIVIPSLLIIGISLVHSLLTIKEPVPRMQMRWIAFGGLVGIVGLVTFGIVGEYMFEAFPTWSNDRSTSRFWFGLSSLLLSTVFPISLAIAVLRYRLWDIDIIINRSLVYGSLTAVLALIYFGSVVLLETLFRTSTGQGSPIAIVISTLVIAGLFSPLRRRVQLLIDRRFYRRKYDAEQILGRFAASVRDEPDLDRLAAELQRVSMSAMQAEHVSVWLKDPAGATRRP